MLTPLQHAIAWVEIVLLSALLAGLVLRRAGRVCPTFVAYIAGVLAADVAVAWRPELFQWEFWMGVEVLHAALKLALAFELSLRLFAGLPGARATTQAAMLLVAALTLVAVLRAPPAPDSQTLAQTLLPPVLKGTAWILGLVFGLVLWHRIPTHPLHRAILRGLVPYLLLFTLALDTLRTFGWDVRLLASYGYTLSYQVVLLYWNAVVWRSHEEPPVAREVVRALQPWR
jgi:hypothetical protein